MGAALGRGPVQKIDQSQDHENGARVGNLALQVALFGCVGLHRLGVAITVTRISLTRMVPGASRAFLPCNPRELHPRRFPPIATVFCLIPQFSSDNQAPWRSRVE